MQRRVLYILLAVTLTLAIGTAGYVFVSGYSWGDAVYMAVISMTTVGYLEVQPLHGAGRIFNGFYLLLSVGVMFLAVGVMTNAIFEIRLRDFLGKRRTRKMLDQIQNHYIVCGFGRVGRGAAAELKAAKIPVLVIDRRDDRVEWAMRQGFVALSADSTRDEVLREARIDRATGLIAALATDADNLFAVLSARGLNPGLRIAARAAEEDAEKKMRLAGADVVYAPYTMAGTRLAQSLMKPHVHEFLSFATTAPGQDVRIEQIAIAPSSDLVGRTLADLQLRREHNVIVLAILRAGSTMQFNPPADAAIGAGDFLIVMGDSGPLRRLEQRVAGVHA